MRSSASLESFLTDVKIVQAADRLLADERQQRIQQALGLVGVDDRNFKLEWANPELTTGYTLRGLLAKGANYSTYSLSVHKLGEPSSRLRFNETAPLIRVIDGPLKVAMQPVTWEQAQIHLATLVHQALGDLIIDSYCAAANWDAY